jgi:hypothetical protein
MTDTEPKPRRQLSPDALTTLLEIAGVLLICGGVAAIYWPAAMILAGVGALAVSWRLTR